MCVCCLKNIGYFLKKKKTETKLVQSAYYNILLVYRPQKIFFDYFFYKKRAFLFRYTILNGQTTLSKTWPYPKKKLSRPFSWSNFFYRYAPRIVLWSTIVCNLNTLCEHTIYIKYRIMLKTNLSWCMPHLVVELRKQICLKNHIVEHYCLLFLIGNAK